MNYEAGKLPPHFPRLPEGWQSEATTFQSADGKVELFRVLHHKKIQSKDRPKRILLVVHGMGEHGGRYLHFPHYLKDVVDGVCCLDHRGHGRSGGPRGHARDFRLLADDVELTLRELKKEGASLHLFGHSVGGLVVLQNLFNSASLPIESVSVSAPALAYLVKVPPLKKAFGRMLKQIWGGFHLSTNVDSRKLSRDPAVKEAYDEDRLVHGKITPDFFFSMEELRQDLLMRTSGISYPLQMMLPEDDAIVDTKTSLQFFHQLKLRDKTLRVYPKFFHESFNEIGKEKAFTDLASWIEKNSMKDLSKETS